MDYQWRTSRNLGRQNTGVRSAVPLEIFVRFERVGTELTVEDLFHVDRVLQQVVLELIGRLERTAAFVALEESVRFGVQLHVNLKRHAKHSILFYLF